MKIAITGSRACTEFELVQREVENIIMQIDDTDLTVIYGCASGVDEAVDLMKDSYPYCEEDSPVEFIMKKADWNIHGKAAGPIRNQEMAEEADLCLAFWNGSIKNSGTFDMIKRCNRQQVKTIIIPI